MIVKIGRAGASFRGLGRYLTDDKERVAWSLSLNCAHDNIGSVIDEMFQTFKDAELLKQEAGVHAGGSRIEKPVKHYSLSWHLDEHPSREEVIEAAQDFLKKMGAEDHQAFLVAHTDKAHAHVHIMASRIHPETGRGLNERFEKVRASEWALDYERAHGLVRCEQRLLEPDERTPSPSRQTWEQLRSYEQTLQKEDEAIRHEYDGGYLAREQRQGVIVGEEWRILKESQRAEREAFFAEGKEVYRELRDEIYREVRETTRPAWRAYYEATRDYPELADAESRAETKKQLIQWQKALIDDRFTEAAANLRTQRDQEYRSLLIEQKQDRHELHARQEMGLNSRHLLDRAAELVERDIDREPGGPDFAAAAREVFAKKPEPEDGNVSENAEADDPGLPFAAAENPRVRDGIDAVGGVGLGLLGALGLIGERLFDGFFGAAPANQNARQEEPLPKPKRDPEAIRENSRARAAVAAARADEAEQEQARRTNEYWRERRRERERD